MIIEYHTGTTGVFEEGPGVNVGDGTDLEELKVSHYMTLCKCDVSRWLIFSVGVTGICHT